MKFRVLGPLEYFDGHRWCGLSSAKLRSLLAYLLLKADQLVATDRLVEELWAGSPPRSATNLVHQYVLRLRRTLADQPARLLVTRPDGYQLSLTDDAELDSRRFTDLLAGAQLARQDGDAEQAAAGLRDALALWRGPALADVTPTPAVAAEAARLEELRLAAIEVRVDAELDGGRTDGLVAELRTLVREHPLREKLWWYLMLALYRVGRQADALCAYREIQQLLDRELAVQPGADLRRLHQRILRGDPDPTGPVPAGGAAGSVGGGQAEPVPRQLPADIRTFAGRTAELVALDKLLPDNDTGLPAPVLISAIAGTAGVGKTALAVHWAHRVIDRFPDGQLYVNLRGFHPEQPPMPATEAIRGVLDALKVPPRRVPTDLVAAASLYRSSLAGRRMLILLDNARDPAQVRPLLPGTAGCLVVVTSRNLLTGLVAVDGASPLALGLLSDAEAHELLRRRLGAARLAAEPVAVDEIITRCAGLPLALAIVAARAATRPDLPLTGLARELSRARPDLQVWHEPDPAADIRTAFDVSYRTLTPVAARLFRLLGLHPGPEISAPAAASLLGVPRAHAGPLLDELSSAHLLTEHSAHRYGLHDLLRTYAAALVHRHDDDDTRHAATARMLDFYLHTAHAAALLINSYRGLTAPAPPDPAVTPETLTTPDAPIWLAREQAVLIALIAREGGGFDRHRWHLARAVAEFLQMRGRWHDWLATQTTALELAGRLADPLAEAISHRGVAGAHISLGDYGRAYHHLASALERYRQLGDREQQVHAHHDVAVVLGEQGLHQEARSHNEQALALSRQVGDLIGQAIALNGIGWNLVGLGDYQQAIHYCEEALELQERAADRRGQAPTLDTLGCAHHHLGQYQQAVDRYTRALGLAREAGDRYGEATILHHLGDTHHAAGEPDAAQVAWSAALPILEELPHPEAAQVTTKLNSIR